MCDILTENRIREIVKEEIHKAAIKEREQFKEAIQGVKSMRT